MAAANIHRQATYNPGPTIEPVAQSFQPLNLCFTLKV